LKHSVADDLLGVLSNVMIGLVKRDDVDLSARGLSILLLVDTMAGPPTVRGLTGRLDIAKPSVTRTLDRLEVLGLVRRVPDPDDGRSVLIRPTKAGSAYVGHFGTLTRGGGS
jgi:DNA-binding MarR family transcriptional regulator